MHEEAAVSWCDKLASTPSVGLKFDHHFAPSSEIMDALSPLLDQLVEGEKIKFTITKQDAFGFEFATEDGFHYGVDPTRVWMEFKHRLRVRATSAGPPVAELSSRPLPFSELLPTVATRLREATVMILPLNARKLMRAGVVATTTVAEDELPPGMMRFIKYINRPWPGMVKQFNFQIVAELGRSDDWFDQCAHTVVRSEDPEELLALQFDWSRTFHTGRSANEAVLRQILADVQDASMAYFEELAEGNRFDEELLRSATRA